MPESGIRAGILGLGSYVPEKVLTNRELEKMVDTKDQWIVTMTGIRERRIASPQQATSDLALEAARKALDDAKISPAEVDLIIVATNTPDHLFPATACIVQDRLGAHRAGAFDLLAGCTGFMYALSVGAQFVESGMYRHVLVIGAETLSRIIDWEDRNTCVIFGDGAGAAIIGRVPEGYGLIHTKLGSDGSGGQYLDMPAGGSKMPACRESVDNKMHFLRMNGREVFKFAVRACGDGSLEALKSAGLALNDLDFLIPHQANIRIIEAAAKRLQLPMEKVLVNVDRFGNTSTASIPMALEEAVNRGSIKDGDNILMTGFGAGLTWAVTLMRWYDYRSGNR
ncbi:MAG: 3-oxoacyl-ACP synthase [Peptococcaceae bacterium BRH_c4a]|nr:MAG: 3-oxoacyl-ACP synthase [Peptococcaceae bacterium BRH_c4a]